MKLTKINLNELSNADLNEREMCRLLGGSGNCQCSCAGSSTTGTNDSYNNASGLSSTTASSGGSGTNPSYTQGPDCFYANGTAGCTGSGLDCDHGIVHGACY